MKEYTILILSILLLLGCGETKRQNFTTLTDDGEIVMSNESIAIFEEIEADYNACKVSESEERECNHFTAEAICRFYEIDDFKKGYEGILLLPRSARFGVYMAYKYYFKLFNKIKQTPAENVLNERIRLPNYRKMRILLTSYVRHNLNLL